MKFTEFTEQEVDLLAGASQYPAVSALLKAVAQRKSEIERDRKSHMRINCEDITDDMRYKLGQEDALEWIATIEQLALKEKAKQKGN